MKKTIIAALVATVFAGTSYAADVIELKKGVSFNHKAHAETLKECKKCHGSDSGGKIEGLGKDLAHKNGCKDCHTEMKKGPTNCKGCHSK